MPSMDGGGLVGVMDDCAMADVMAMSLHDLERPSAVLVPPSLPASRGTDRNGNNLMASFSYADMQGSHAQL